MGASPQIKVGNLRERGHEEEPRQVVDRHIFPKEIGPRGRWI
jgi:hypothetical protein